MPLVSSFYAASGTLLFEIDDSSAAKALLDEVVASGDEVQIAEAKAVLAELKGE